MQLTLEIPVKSVVYKFLTEKYGTAFPLNKRSHLGISLFSMLRRQLVDNRLNPKLMEYTHSFQVKVSEHAFFEKGCRNLSANTIFQFNCLVEDLIETELCGTVEFLEMYGVEQKQAIEAFMAKYGFEENDVKFDSLKKAYQRYWIRKQNAGRKKLKGVEFLPFLYVLQTANAVGSRKKMKKVTKMSA